MTRTFDTIWRSVPFDRLVRQDRGGEQEFEPEFIIDGTALPAGGNFGADGKRDRTPTRSALA